MPQKYDKNMKPLPGFKPNDQTLRMVRQQTEEHMDKKRAKGLRRKFMAEPEELKMLDALQTLPEGQRQSAAEGLLISRVAKRKGLI